MRLIGDSDWPTWAWDIPAVVLLAVAPVFFLREAPGGLPPYGGDILVHVYPLLSLLSHGLHAGRPTLWNYYAAGGYPLAPYSALSFYPPVLLALLLLPVTGALAALYAFYLAVLGVGTYLLAADLGQSRPARLLAAVTLAYGGFVAAHAYAGHIFEIGAICPMPLAFLLLRRAIRHGSLVTAIWCGAVVGLMVLAAGVQFLPFALAPLPLLVVWYTFAPLPRIGSGWWALWPCAALIVAGLVALALSAVFVLPFAEILPDTLRAGAVRLKTAAAQSLPWPGLTMLIAPNGLGNAADGSYWLAGRSSPYFHEIYAYAGVLPLLLAPVALVRCRAARPYAALALLALLVMLGGNTPFYGLLYHLPGGALVRVPARAGLILGFALALLAGFGLDALCATGPATWRRLGLLAPGLAVALAALAALLTIAMRAGYTGGIPRAARALALGGAARLAVSLVVGLAACLIVIIIARRRSLASARGAWALALPALALLDLFSSNGALLRPRDPAVYYSAARAGVLSPRDATYRVFAPAPGSAAPAIPLGLCMVTRACYDVQDAAPLALEEYWRFSHPSIVQRQHGGVATGRDTAIDVYPPFLRLFGVRTLYSAAPLSRVTGLQPAGFVTSTRWSVPGGANWNTATSVAPSFVYDNPAALPRVFVAPRAVLAPSTVEALARVQAPQTDLRQVAVLSVTQARAAGPLGVVQQAWANWLAGDTDNSLTTRAGGGTGGGYLVMDDGWFPGWTATIDGRAVPVLRADYLLRAVHLPPGGHTVRFVYAPLVYLLGAAVTLVTALGLLLLAAYSLIWRRRRRAVAPAGVVESHRALPQRADGRIKPNANDRSVY